MTFPSQNETDWASVWSSERDRIIERRLREQISAKPTDPRDTVGLALSGGGIRSATFSLGLMRAFAQSRVLEGFDYISTVSGGGYAGAFFCSQFARSTQASIAPKAPAAPVTTQGAAVPTPYDVLRGPICRPGSGTNTGWSLWWLRSSGRYLAPTGAGDYVYALALAIRNLCSIHYVLALSIVSSAAIAIIIDSLVRRLPGLSAIGSLGENPGGGFLVLAMAIFFLVLMPLSLAYFLTEMPKAKRTEKTDHGWWRTPTFIRTLLAAVIALILAATFAPRAVEWLFTTRIGEDISGFLEQFGVMYSGSITVAAITAFVSIQVFASLLYLGRAADFVDSGKHLPESRKTSGRETSQGKMLATRVVLTKRLATGLKSALLLLAVAALLYGSHWLIINDWWKEFVGFAGAGGSILIAVVKKVAGTFSTERLPESRLKVPVELIFVVLAFALALAVTLGWSAFTWAATAKLANATVATLTTPIAPLVGLLGLIIPLGLLTGASFQFVNLSTIQNLYSSRLVRAYLGATNPARSDGLDTRWIRISDTHPNDDLSLDRYYAKDNSAPVHVINVTVNETVSPTDPLVQRDRHGRPLAVCPEHLCVDGVWSARPKDAFETIRSGILSRMANRMQHWVKRKLGRKTSDAAPAPDVSTSQPQSRNPPETLQLGSWIGISGAAFSTGVGRNTSLSKALLLGIANVRLGYWWNAGHLEHREGESKSDSALRFIVRKFRTQTYLVAELFGRFSGRYAPYWYLSDGGHFENTGCYELLRRRVGVIVCSDNGADPSYEWEDLANLMRLARIDFGCEFEELDGSSFDNEENLKAALLAANTKARGEFDQDRCLRFFRVTYPDDSRPNGTLLIIVKPILIETATADVRAYARTSASFPQETTADQFFSEEQWESYRKLGETVGARVAEAIFSKEKMTSDAVVQRWLALRNIAGGSSGIAQ